MKSGAKDRKEALVGFFTNGWNYVTLALVVFFVISIFLSSKKIFVFGIAHPILKCNIFLQVVGITFEKTLF